MLFPCLLFYVIGVRERNAEIRKWKFEIGKKIMPQADPPVAEIPIPSKFPISNFILHIFPLANF